MNVNEIYGFLNVIYRRRYLFVISTVVALSAATLATFLIPKKYRADSTVFIERNVISSLIQGIAVTPDIDDRVRVLNHALLSRDIITKVMAKLNLDVKTRGETEFQTLLEDLKKRTNLTVKEKDLFIVSLTDQDPVFARDFINILVKTYLEENISSKREETYGASRFLNEQIDLLKKKLDETENAIIDFRRSQEILFTPEDEVLLQEIKQFDQEIEMVSLSIDELDAKKDHLKQKLESIQPEITLFSEKQIDNKLYQTEEKLGLLLLSYTENHPQVLKLRAELEELKNQKENAPEPGRGAVETSAINPLYQETTQKILDLEAETTALAAKRLRLGELVSLRKDELRKTPEKRKELAQLTQERDSVRKIYEVLLMRAEQSEVSKQMEIGDKAATFRIVDPAVIPKVPVFPKMPKMLLLTLAVGFGFGFGVILLMEKFDTSIQSSRDLEAFGVTLLGAIPHIESEETRKKSRKNDLLLFGFLGVHSLGIVGIFAFQILRYMA